MASPNAIGALFACPPGGEHGAYRPRAAERGVLYTIVREHLETFLREAAHRAEGITFSAAPSWASTCGYSLVSSASARAGAGSRTG